MTRLHSLLLMASMCVGLSSPVFSQTVTIVEDGPAKLAKQITDDIEKAKEWVQTQLWWTDSIEKTVQIVGFAQQQVDKLKDMYDNAKSQLETVKNTYDQLTQQASGFDFNAFVKNPSALVKWANSSATAWQNFQNGVKNSVKVKFGGTDINLLDPDKMLTALQDDLQTDWDENDNFNGLKKFGFNGAVVKTVQQGRDSINNIDTVRMNLIGNALETVKNYKNSILERTAGFAGLDKDGNPLFKDANGNPRPPSDKELQQTSLMMLSKLGDMFSDQLAIIATEHAQRAQVETNEKMKTLNHNLSVACTYLAQNWQNKGAIESVLNCFPGNGESSTDFLKARIIVDKTGTSKSSDVPNSDGLSSVSESTQYEHTDNLFYTYYDKLYGTSLNNQDKNAD